MTLYKGEIMGIKYGFECEDEKALIDELVEMIQLCNPLFVEVMKKLMEQK